MPFEFNPLLRRAQRGVTLIEMLIVMTLIALLAAIAYPSAASGLEAVKLRSTADNVVNFLNAAIDHAERRQQVVEVWIAPKDNVIIARSPDLGFVRRFNIPESFHITAVRPAAEVAPDDPRRFLLYPGGTIPRMGIEITGGNGRKREVIVDPLTGMPRSEIVIPGAAPENSAPANRVVTLGGGSGGASNNTFKSFGNSSNSATGNK
jgi:prepilin-type N-terminal cleavage/methylation domain-containing protein